MKTALLYLGFGKPHNEVLLSLRELPKEPPEERLRVFYLADSTVAMLEDDVAPPKMLERKLANEYGKDSVEVIDWAFGCASMFHHYCLTCKSQEYSPSLIIFTINYRRFGWKGQSDMRQRNGDIFGHDLAVFAPLRENFSEGITSPVLLENLTFIDRLKLQAEFWEVYYLRGLKIWIKDILGQSLYDNISLEAKWNEKNQIRQTKANQVVVMLSDLEFTPEMLSDLYPMDIPSDIVETRLLEALVDALQRRGIPFIAYVTPFNIKALKEFGVYDEELFKRNIGHFEKIVTAHGGVFLDLSNLMEPGDFQDRLEHYNPEGGKKVVDKLAPKVRAILDDRQGQKEPRR